MTTSTTRAGLTLLATTLLAATAALLVAPAHAAPTAPTTPAKPFDLNGDGRGDVVTGIPGWDAGGTPRVENSGAVLVLWGGRNGVPETLITEATAGVPGDPADGDDFGAALASADFDTDGYADLAVGAPFDEPVVSPAGVTSGTVTIFYGSATGIGGRVSQVGPGEHSGFGRGLAAADLTGDGRVDLAVGATGDTPRPDEDFGSGAVVVLEGSPAGFALARSSTVARPEDAMASFGTLLATGDLDGDGDQDLVEGYAGIARSIDDPAVPGHVTYALGTGAGLGPAVRLSSARATAIAVGDVNRDGLDEVVVGAALRSSYGEDQPLPRGRVTIHRGTATGPAATARSITQASPGVPGSDEHGDLFGAAVGLSDIDRDGGLDLVIGAPGEDHGRGRITILRGTRKGITAKDAVTLDQASPEIPGKPERNDRFGAAIALLDVNNDGPRDLVIGSPGENRFRGTVTIVQLRGIFYSRAGVRSYSLESLGQTGGGPQKEFGSVLAD